MTWGVYEAIVFIDDVPYAVGVRLPEMTSRVFEGSSLYNAVKEGLEVKVWFPEWRDLEVLVRVAFGQKGGVRPPLHVFHWRIEKIHNIDYSDDLGHIMVKVIKYSGEIPSKSFLSDKISRGCALALEAAVVYSRLVKYPHVGNLHERYWSLVSEISRLSPKLAGTLLEISGRPHVLWVITGGYTWLRESLQIIKQLMNVSYVKVLVTQAGKHVLSSVHEHKKLPVLEGERAYCEASSVVSGEYDLVVIAPATSNTISKIAMGIADTPASIAATHALKIGLPVIILPTDYLGVMFLEDSKREIDIHPYFKCQVEFLKALGYHVVRDPKDLIKTLKKYIPEVSSKDQLKVE
ncbi:MAG: hypothetical protein DRN26_01185 [Thermoplasmata archaeon]|nr:MAG: hypothetical protein DRN26_01185 [Thermoplasmata archaeon]